MDEMLKIKKRLLVNFVILLVLSITSIFLVLVASTGFKGNGAILILLGMFLIQIPVIVTLGSSGLKAVSQYIVNEERRRNIGDNEIEELEKEVEEKAKEADELSFNLIRLEEEMGKFTDLATFGEQLLVGISKQIDLVTGMVYSLNSETNKFQSIASYAYYSSELPPEFESGDGLTGQVVKDKKAMFLNELPEGYVKVVSGLGKHKPKFLTIIPVIIDGEVVGVIELATFKSMERGLSNRVQDISKFFEKKAKQL